MFQIIQKHQKLFQILMGLMFIPLVFGGISGVMSDDNVSDVAKVGDQKITLDEFEFEYRNYKDQMRQAMGSAFDEVQFNSAVARQSYLSSMVDRALLKEAVVKEHLLISDQMLVKTLVNNPQMPKNAQGGIDMEQYEGLLKQQNQSVASFEAALRADLSVTPIMAAASFSYEILPLQSNVLNEIFSKIQIVEQKKMDVTPYLNSVTVTQEQVKRYFQMHESEFNRPAFFDVEYLRLPIPVLPASYIPTDAELKLVLSTPNATTDELKSARKDVQLMRSLLPKVNQLKATEFAKKIVDSSRASPKDLKALATKFGGAVQVFSGLSRLGSESLPSALKEQSVREALTSSHMVASNAIGDPIALGSDLIIGRVTKSIAAGVQPFESVQAEIEQKLKRQAAIDKMLVKVNTDIATMNSAIPIGSPEMVGYLLKKTMSARTLAQVMGVTSYPKLFTSENDDEVSIVRVVSSAPSVPIGQLELKQQLIGWQNVGIQLQQGAFISVLRERYDVKIYPEKLGSTVSTGKS